MFSANIERCNSTGKHCATIPGPAPALLFSTLVLAAACGGSTGGTSGEASSAAEWVSETVTEGDVTTVTTVSGSVWGGSATLVEEVSIGVESGDDAYMLGSVRAIIEDGGEIFVLDQQVPIIRVYDLSGQHLRDIGAEGNGPGEFERPESMVIDPAGRLFIRDPRNGRIMILSKDGEELGTIRITSSFSTSNPMVVTRDGTVYNYELLNRGSDVTDWSLGMIPMYEDEEMEGEPVSPPEYDYEPPQLVARSGGSTSVNNVPFTPGVQWTLSPSGAVIGGVSDDYSFDIRRTDGTMIRVIKSWEPIPVDPEESAWRKRSTTANMRSTQADWSWSGADIPSTKPAFSQLLADFSGRIWVRRPGPGYHVEEECNEDPQPGEPFGTACWGQDTTWEVFDEEGRFLGGAALPERVRTFPQPYIRDDLFLATHMDDMGTVTVKKYRIVPPAH